MNKKFYFLDNKEWLLAQLLTKSMAQLAKELSEQYGHEKASLAGSIRFMVYRYFTKQERALMKKERAFHRNRKKKSS